MKTVVIAVLILALVVTPALAAPGGMPAAHGVDGKTFGKLVSDLARSGPGAVADHVAAHGGDDGEEQDEEEEQGEEQDEEAGGMPAAHGVDGKTFGKLVRDLARSGPGAVARHLMQVR